MGWECVLCETENSEDSTACEICLSARVVAPSPKQTTTAAKPRQPPMSFDRASAQVAAVVAATLAAEGETGVLPTGPWSCDLCHSDNATANTFCKICQAPFSSSGPEYALKQEKIKAERQKNLAAEAEAERQRRSAANADTRRQIELMKVAAAEAQRKAAADSDAAKAEAERQRKLTADAEAERRKIAAAEAEAERQRKLAADWDAETERQKIAAAEAEAERLLAAAAEADERFAAAERQKKLSRREMLYAETERLSIAAAEAERQRKAAADADAAKAEAERKKGMGLRPPGCMVTKPGGGLFGFGTKVRWIEMISDRVMEYREGPEGHVCGRLAIMDTCTVSRTGHTIEIIGGGVNTTKPKKDKYTLVFSEGTAEKCDAWTLYLTRLSESEPR